MRKYYAILLKIFTVVTAFAVGVLWTKASSVAQTTNSMRADQLPVDPSGQVSFLLDQPLSTIGIFGRTLLNYSDNYTQTLLGTVGWNLSPLPLIFILLTITALVVTTLYLRDEVLKIPIKSRLLVTILALCGISSYFFIMYLAFSPVGWSYIDGVNGRYFIAYLPLVAVSLASIMPATNILTTRLKSLVPIISTITLIASIVIYYMVTRG